MDNSLYTITLDLHSTISQAQISLKKNDSARSLYMLFFEDGVPFKLEDATVKMYYKKPAGTITYCSCTNDDYVAECPIDEDISGAAGIVECEAVIMGEQLYRRIATAVAPTFVSGKYYSKNMAVYTVLTNKPGDWDTSWTNYYETYNLQITSPRFTIIVEDTLESEANAG